jgi:hypothetical protein
MAEPAPKWHAAKRFHGVWLAAHIQAKLARDDIVLAR